MHFTIHSITFDAHDAYRQSLFWTELTGFEEDPDDPNHPEDTEQLIRSADGHDVLLFINVPESKQVKNRIHLDLQPTERTRDEEVERVLGIGATVVDDQRQENGTGWVVMADPEGNEFCILRSGAERQASSAIGS